MRKGQRRNNTKKRKLSLRKKWGLILFSYESGLTTSVAFLSLPEYLVRHGLPLRAGRAGCAGKFKRVTCIIKSLPCRVQLACTTLLKSRILGGNWGPPQIMLLCPHVKKTARKNHYISGFPLRPSGFAIKRSQSFSPTIRLSAKTILIKCPKQIVCVLLHTRFLLCVGFAHTKLLIKRPQIFFTMVSMRPTLRIRNQSGRC